MGRSGVQTEGLLFPFKLQGGCPKASWARLTFPTRYKHHQVTKWLLKKKKDEGPPALSVSAKGKADGAASA